MKRHCLFVLSCITLLNVSLCLSRPSGAQKRAHQKAQRQLALTTMQPGQGTQQLIEKNSPFLENATLPSSSISITSPSEETFEPLDEKTLNEARQASKQRQFPLGAFDAEINKGVLMRLFWESRHVRETAEQMMRTYDPNKHELGTGDQDELKRLIIAARDSYLDHNQIRNLAVLITFVTEQKIQGLEEELSKERLLTALKAEQASYEKKIEELKPLEEEVQRLADTTCKIQAEVSPINAALAALEQLTVQKK